MAKDMYASVSCKDIRVEMTAEGCSWNPDIANDLIRRVREMFDETLKAVIEYEGLEYFDDEDDEIDVEAVTEIKEDDA